MNAEVTIETIHDDFKSLIRESSETPAFNFQKYRGGLEFTTDNMQSICQREDGAEILKLGLEYGARFVVEFIQSGFIRLYVEFTEALYKEMEPHSSLIMFKTINEWK